MAISNKQLIKTISIALTVVTFTYLTPSLPTAYSQVSLSEEAPVTIPVINNIPQEPNPSNPTNGEIPNEEPQNPETPDPVTPSPEPEIPPYEGACYLKAVTLNMDTSNDADDSRSGQQVLVGSVSSMSCVQQFLTECNNDGKQGVGMISDDCVGNKFLKSIGENDPVVVGQLKPFVDAMAMGAFSGAIPDFIGVMSGPVKAYCDDECKCKKYVADGEVCTDAGSINWIASPVSLLWYGDVDIDGESSISSFPLDPSKSGAKYAWKASSHAPLVVYDPQHLGQITAASQLFGNHSFGRKFENGFQAMATLDSNGDGELSGMELAPLGLWFDENRDGVSQTGEVKPIVESGVTALYFTPDRTDSKTGSVFASNGYQRVEGGKHYKGAAVDWYGGEYASKADAAVEQFLNVKPGEQIRSSNQLSGFKKASALSGYWNWTIDNSKSTRSPKGILSFRETDDGSIKGISFIEVQLKRNSKKFQSTIVSTPLSGKIEMIADGRIKISFELVGVDGLQTESVAYLSSDGRTLTGSSASKANLMKDGRTEKKSLNYSWTASRAG